MSLHSKNILATSCHQVLIRCTTDGENESHFTLTILFYYQCCTGLVSEITLQNYF